MKKIVCILAAVIIGVGMFCGCGTKEPAKKSPLTDKDLELQIKQSYVYERKTIYPQDEVNVDDVNFLAYYGTYGDCVVITAGFDQSILAMVFEYDIYGVKMRFGRWRIKIWRKGLLYDLQDAPKYGLLNRNAILKINICFNDFEKYYWQDDAAYVYYVLDSIKAGVDYDYDFSQSYIKPRSTNETN